MNISFKKMLAGTLMLSASFLSSQAFAASHSKETIKVGVYTLFQGPLFAEKTRELISKEKVDAIFGCWTSVSHKSVLPIIEELNGLMFYPVQYEGEESSKNIFYTGAAPNQQAIPAVNYLMNEIEVKRWVLAGTDYVYPRTTNKILKAYLISKGVAESDIMIRTFANNSKDC